MGRGSERGFGGMSEGELGGSGGHLLKKWDVLGLLMGLAVSGVVTGAVPYWGRYQGCYWDC